MDTKKKQLVVKEWVSNEPPPQKMRWKMSFWDGSTVYFESESDSLWYVFRVMYLAWKQTKRK